MGGLAGSYPQNQVIVPDPHTHLTLWDVWRPDGCGGEQRIIEVGFFSHPSHAVKSAFNPPAGREGSEPRAKLGMEKLWLWRFAPPRDVKNACMPEGDFLLFHSALSNFDTRTSLHFLHSAGTLKPAEPPITSVNRSSVHAVHACICILEHLLGVRGDAISRAACQGPIKGRQQEGGWIGAWLQPGIGTEVPLPLFQMALTTRAIKLMSKQLAGKIGSHVKHFGARWGN